MIPLIAVVGVTAAWMLYCHWLHHCVNQPTMSGDKWYIRQMAFTDMPISAPYCWRPLVPFIARFTGFTLLSYSCTMATPIIIYYWMGQGWTGFACGLLFTGNIHLLQFNVRNPEYAESVGQFLMLASLWAMSIGHWAAWPLLLLAALCRETLAAALGLIALFWNPLLLIPRYLFLMIGLSNERILAS